MENKDIRVGFSPPFRSILRIGGLKAFLPAYPFFRIPAINRISLILLLNACTATEAVPQSAATPQQVAIAAVRFHWDRTQCELDRAFHEQNGPSFLGAGRKNCPDEEGFVPHLKSGRNIPNRTMPI